MAKLPAHSPLGASGAGRWMNCPGSVRLSKGVDDPNDDTYSKPGTFAHELAEKCLNQQDDAWMYVGTEHPDDPDLVVDKEMADAVQLYVDEVRRLHPDRNQGNSWVERKFHCPDLHEFFYGTADFVYLDEVKREVHVWDFKYGAGIVVEAKENPQLMYYACGALEDLMLDEVDVVHLHIMQPRAWHSMGPHRTWSTENDALQDWLDLVLIPAMDRAMTSDEVVAGDHCRFCPVLARECPATMAAVDELEDLMEKYSGKDAPAMPPETASRILRLGKIFKMVHKQTEKTAFNMLSRGTKVDGYKLGKARSNRKHKEGAEDAAIATFGKDRAFTTPTLKSPAQLEALPGGAEFTAQWSYKPDAGLTLIEASDSRPEVSRDTKSMFTDVTKGNRR